MTDPTPARPLNIILIVSDEHQAATCGCYGSPVQRKDGRSPTPNIDALAAAGTRFDAMYCPSPLCAPSRAAYMTGRHPHTTTAIHHKMQGREAGLTRFPGVIGGIQAMGDYFRRAGYRTATIGKVHVHGELTDGWDLGFDQRALRFYTEFPGNHYNELHGGDVNRRYRELPPYSDRRYREIDPLRFAHAPDDLRVRDNDVNQYYLETLVEREEEMVDYLATRRGIQFAEECVAAGRPFLLHLGLEKPHRPWTVNQRYLDLFDPAAMPIPATTAEWLERGMIPTVQHWCHSPVAGDDARRSIAAYYACAAAVDEYVGHVVDTCRRLGILDQTLIIYTSDHGESLYERGLIEKHNMLEPAVRVPLVARLPGTFPPAAVVTAPTSLIDLLPTFCELAGLPTEAGVEGQSLLPVVAGSADPDRLIFSEFHSPGNAAWPADFTPIRMALNRQWKYIFTHAAVDQLFDREADPTEDRNLALDPAFESTVSHLRLCALADFELDEYPRFSATATVAHASVQLSWEDPGNPAQFDVYRAHGTDPRSAQRIAAGLTVRHWTDTAPLAGAATYWILGREILARPFIDPRGNSRYGTRPVIAAHHPMFLPVSEPVRVPPTPTTPATGDAGLQFDYQPLLGFQLGGQPWIHIGHPPSIVGTVARFAGPSIILTPRVVSDPHTLAVRLQSQPGDPQLAQAAELILNYRNMHQFYAFQLHRDGVARIYRVAGPQRGTPLAESRPTGLDPSAWHSFEARAANGQLSLRIDGRCVLQAIDPQPLAAGRAGINGDLHLRTFAFEALSVG
jgi:iduronate 2-sulfatase